GWSRWAIGAASAPIRAPGTRLSKAFATATPRDDSRGAGPQAPTTQMKATEKRFMVVMLPNESRLSCGAELECSQTEVYYTVLQDVHRIWCGLAPAASSAG